MSITRKAVTRLTLDMGMPDCQTSAAVTKGDVNRRWEITVTDNGAAFPIPDTWTVILAGIKPDDNPLYNGCVVDDGKIIYDFESGPQIATCEGTFRIQFDIFDEEGDVVATPKIWVDCQKPARGATDGIESMPEYTIIEQFIAEANQLRAELDELEARIDSIENRMEVTA